VSRLTLNNHADGGLAAPGWHSLWQADDLQEAELSGNACAGSHTYLVSVPESLYFGVTALVDVPRSSKARRKVAGGSKVWNFPHSLINYEQEIPQGLSGDMRLPYTYRWPELMEFNFDTSFHSLRG